MITETLTSYYQLVKQLPPAAVLKLYNVSWDEYETLLEEVGEASGLRISYDNGVLQIMTLSSEHEKYVRFFEKLVTLISLRLHINILSFGSATLRQRKKQKGNEPDACFYVQNADLIGNRLRLDFSKDQSPDVAVEVDIHHDSQNKLAIYAGLEIPEVWRYDGAQLTIYHRQADAYQVVETSIALPMLSAALLTRYLNRLREDGEFNTLVAFEQELNDFRF